MHILKSTRTSEDGQTLGSKCRTWEDKKSGPRMCKEARNLWRETANAALVKTGLPPMEEPDEETPRQIHLGPKRAAMERRGVHTEAGTYNREVSRLRKIEAALKEQKAEQVAENSLKEETRPLALEVMENDRRAHAGATRTEWQAQHERVAGMMEKLTKSHSMADITVSTVEHFPKNQEETAYAAFLNMLQRARRTVPRVAGLLSRFIPSKTPEPKTDPLPAATIPKTKPEEEKSSEQRRKQRTRGRERDD